MTDPRMPEGRTVTDLLDERERLYAEVSRLAGLSAMHRKQRDDLLAVLEALYTFIGEAAIDEMLTLDGEATATLEALLDKARAAIAAAQDPGE